MRYLGQEGLLSSCEGRVHMRGRPRPRARGHEAIWHAELAPGDAPPRMYIVEPVGDVEEIPAQEGPVDRLSVSLRTRAPHFDKGRAFSPGHKSCLPSEVRSAGRHREIGLIS